MQSSLLQTKLHIPSPRPDWVTRPRLVERLNTGVYRKLTLISAPAGFGKTTLVSEWIADCEQPTAWLSLDENDNDLTRFLTYLIGTLQTIQADIGKGVLNALQSPQPPPVEGILTTIINEIATLDDRIILVLDDYHLINAQPIHDTLTFLVRHLPQTLHLVISTREDPSLPLARYRARGQMTELRAADLRFSTVEAAEFLNKVIDIELLADDIAALEKRTEGWIAGLQLAAISMKGSVNTKDFIQSFTGSHRYVLDYLIEEVLEQQSEDLQTFMLRTSILDRLNGSLCDEVTGQENGQANLETLERANLFIVPLDEDRRWYRYHHLFADLLRQRLRHIQPEQIPILHRRASDWYAQNDFVDQAIEHALHAEDYEQMAYLIEENVDAMWQRGAHNKLRRWLDRLPITLLHAKPYLCVFHALYALRSGKLETATHSIQALEHMLEPATEDQQTNGPRILHIEGWLATLRAFNVWYSQQDVSRVIQYANIALNNLPKEDLIWRSIAAIALGDAYSVKGDMKATAQAQIEALASINLADDAYMRIVVNTKLANTRREQGQLRRTVEVCEQQMQLLKELGLTQMGMAGWVLSVWGEALVELNDLDHAIDLASEGVAILMPGGDVAMLGWSYLCLIRVLFSRGDISEAKNTIQRLKSESHKSTLPSWLMNQTSNWQTRIWLTEGRLDAAIHWAEMRGIDIAKASNSLHALNYFQLDDYVMLARVMLAQGHLDDTTTLLQGLFETAKAGDRISKAVEILLLQALTYQKAETIGQAMTALDQALVLAKPGGHIGVFLDEGLLMKKLLREAFARDIQPDYSSRILLAFPTEDREIIAKPKTATPQSELIEPLSERELDVLELLAEGLTNREIASRLYLALNTVKAHTRNIYGKLDVHNRTQAITRALALGLLPRK